jgi:hypothetical protein
VKVFVASVSDIHSVRGGLTCHNAVVTLFGSSATRLLLRSSLISFACKWRVRVVLSIVLHIPTLVFFLITVLVIGGTPLAWSARLRIVGVLWCRYLCCWGRENDRNAEDVRITLAMDTMGPRGILCCFAFCLLVLSTLIWAGWYQLQFYPTSITLSLLPSEVEWT